MKIHLVCYATPSHQGSQLLLEQTALQNGFDHVFKFNPSHLDQNFINKNKNIFKLKFGAGSWVWKPYIVLKALNSIDKDDVLIYVDADYIILNNVKPMVDLCIKNGFSLYASPRPAKVWTKRDCFVITGMDTKEAHNTCLTPSSIHCWRRNTISYTILGEWLHYAQDERISTRSPENECNLPNLEGFKRHSTDQSILTMLSIKHGIERFLRPDVHPDVISSMEKYHIKKCFNSKILRTFGRFSLDELDLLKRTPKVIECKASIIQQWVEIPSISRRKGKLINNIFYNLS